MNCALFVHIPKTAGTSFRTAAVRRFKERVAWDYGPGQADTTDFLDVPRGEPIDVRAVRQEIRARRLRLLGGHVHYRRYARIFPPERVITFVREPLERTVSEFFHFQRNYGYEGTLLDFARLTQNQNRQSKLLKGAPLDEIGLLGVSERYRDSLQVLRQRFGWEIPYLKTNVNPSRRSLDDGYVLEDAEVEEIRGLNAEDEALYAYAREALDEATAGLLRQVEAEQGALSCRGAVDSYENGWITGWAALDEGRFDCRVLVRVGSEPVIAVSADRFRKDLRTKGMHVSGHGGFRARVGRLPGGTEVRVVVEGTGRELTNSPFVVGADDGDEARP